MLKKIPFAWLSVCETAALLLFTFHSSVVMSAEEATANRTSEAVCTERVRQVLPTLEPENHMRTLLEHYPLTFGDRIHHVWMDKMKRYGVKSAYLDLRFVWKDGIKDLEVVNVHYARQYAQYNLAIDDPHQLARIRAGGLERELKGVALREARQSRYLTGMREDGFKRAHGTFTVVLMDEECFPGLRAGEDEFYDDDFTELMRAAAAYEGDFKAVESALARGTDVNARDHHGATALIYAAMQGNAETVRALIAHGAEVNAIDKLGRTPLMQAARFHQREAVKALLDAGAQVNQKNEDGTTALLENAPHDTGDTLEVLLAAGAEVNVQDADGRTPLMEAARFGNVEVVKSLLAAGADVNIRDKAGDTALGSAVYQHQADWAITANDRHEEVIRLLKAAGAKE